MNIKLSEMFYYKVANQQFVTISMICLEMAKTCVQIGCKAILAPHPKFIAFKIMIYTLLISAPRLFSLTSMS